MKTFFWRSSEIRYSCSAQKVAKHFYGQVWGNSGKNPSHPQKFACSYTGAFRCFCIRSCSTSSLNPFQFFFLYHTIYEKQKRHLKQNNRRKYSF